VPYVIGNVGRLRRRVANLHVGFPVFGDNYSRLFVSYGIDQQSFTGSSTNTAFTAAFRCNDCVRSTVGASLMRDTRIDLPFPTAGTMAQFGLSQSGGVLGGKGNFQRVDLEGHFYAPLGQLGPATSSNVKFVLGFSTRSSSFDAGNGWWRPAQFEPTRLFRGAGVGVAVISPLGPLGIDYAYGFDKVDLFGRPAPGWKLHFKLGNFF